MQKTSDLYKEILSGEHWKEYRLVVAEKSRVTTEQHDVILFGGTGILVNDGEGSGFAENVIVNMSTYSGLFSENVPVVGGSVASEISATILKPKTDIPRMSRVVPYVRLCNDEQKSEWVKKGEYYIDKHSYSGEDNELMYIHGFDAMLFSEADFPSSDAEWPRKDIDVVRDIAADMGVSVDPRTVAIMNKGYDVQYPAEYSQREVLGYLAAMYAGSFVMSDDGELRLIQLNGISADVHSLNKRITAFTKAEAFDAYSKIAINVTDELCYEAGEPTGRTLTISCPWGTQEMASNILAQMRGFSYQPFTAEGAILDPAAELGDGVSVNGVSSGIYTIDTTFNSNCTANIAAPFDEEIDYKFPYESKLIREVKRHTSGFSSKLAIQANKIEAEVQQREDDVEKLSGQLSVQANQISAKVSKNEGSSETFGWELKSDSWKIYAGSSTVLEATKLGLAVSGKITATSGSIGGFAINGDHISYNEQTWNGDKTNGIYIGIMGIQLGTNFKVDAAGNLYANSGTFGGTVTAGNILYGKTEDGTIDYGTLNGSALSANTISGGKLKYNTVSTSYTSSGINTSLGWADFANGVFNGYSEAPFVKCLRIDCSASANVGALTVGGRSVSMTSMAVMAPDGSTKTIRYLGWSLQSTT